MHSENGYLWIRRPKLRPHIRRQRKRAFSSCKHRKTKTGLVDYPFVTWFWSANWRTSVWILSVFIENLWLLFTSLISSSSSPLIFSSFSFYQRKIGRWKNAFISVQLLMLYSMDMLGFQKLPWLWITVRDNEIWIVRPGIPKLVFQTKAKRSVLTSVLSLHMYWP